MTFFAEGRGNLVLLQLEVQMLESLTSLVAIAYAAYYTTAHINTYNLIVASVVPSNDSSALLK